MIHAVRSLGAIRYFQIKEAVSLQGKESVSVTGMGTPGVAGSPRSRPLRERSRAMLAVRFSA